MRAHGLLVAVLLAVAVRDSAGQTPLTLAEAVRGTLSRNSTLLAGRAGARGSSEGVPQARSARLPRIEVVESAEHGNQPVFVFSSLLSQRRFTQDDFLLSSLNHPDAVSLHRTLLSVEQLVFDGGAAGASLARARGAASVAAADVGIAEQDLTMAAVVAYAAIGRADAELGAARTAVEAATDDRRRALDRRDAGLVTDADVLASDVQSAAAGEREIRARAARQLAVAEMNALMGEPLEQEIRVAELPQPIQPTSGAGFSGRAEADRLELRRALLSESVAREDSQQARSAFMPQVVARGSYELSGATPIDRAGAWHVGGYLRWRFSTGGAETASARQATAAVERAAHQREALAQRIRLEVRRASVDLESAVARELVGRAAAAQAIESQRIIRDRYEAGLASITDLLRAGEAAADARVRHVGARFDVVVARAALERALGRTPDAIVAAVTP